MSRAPSPKQNTASEKPALAKRGSKLKTQAETPAASPEKVAKPAKAIRVAAAKVKAPVDRGPKVSTAKVGKKMKEKKLKESQPEPVRECFFTFPEADYTRISLLKQRALDAGRKVKKSELLRAGLASLAGMADPAFLQALEGLGKTRSEAA